LPLSFITALEVHAPYYNHGSGDGQHLRSNRRFA